MGVTGADPGILEGGGGQELSNFIQTIFEKKKTGGGGQGSRKGRSVGIETDKQRKTSGG